MTSQEEQMLNALVDRVNGTKLTERDPAAAELLSRGLSSNPDAMYILAQSVLVQNIALEQARAQLTQAQEQLKQQSSHSTSFLGSLLGHRNPTPAQAQAAPPAAAVQPAYQPVYTPQAAPEYQQPYQGQYQPPYQGAPYQGAPSYQPPYQGAPYGGPGYGPPPGQPSFLRSAAQTAAGVAAGALAFEGVEALLHGGFGHPGFGMGMGGWGMPGVGYGMGPGMGMGMGFERPVEETVVNNYYDSPGGGYEHERGGEERLHESGDSGNANAGWENDPGAGPDDGYDASSNDSSGSYDSGSYDSGGGDSGGNFGDDGSI